MKNLLLLFAAATAVLAACTRFDEDIPKAEPAGNPETRTDTVPPGNPYSLANVRKAYAEIMAEAGIDADTLKASHLYVRFLPQDTVHLYILLDSLNLELFDYPLDSMSDEYEAEKRPSSPVNGYIWQYTVVPAEGFTFPDEMKYEILDEVYIQTPERVRADDLVRTGLSVEAASGNGTERSRDTSAVVRRGMKAWPEPQMENDLWESVIDRAMINTGNVVPGPVPLGSKWEPAARILYEDDVTGETVPLEGVKIRVSHFVNVGSGYTDANGEVTGLKGWGGKFRYAVRYKIIFENDRRPKWNLRDGRLGQAKIKGPKQKSRWDYTIRSGNMRESAFAAIHRAVFHFYCVQNAVTKATDGIPTMNISVRWDERDEDRNGNFDPTRRSYDWLGNPIRIWGKDKNDGTFRKRYRLTSSAFHELGHSSHWQSVINTSGVNRFSHYHYAQEKLKESYARGVEYYFMAELYPDDIEKIQPQYFENYTGIGQALLNQGITITELQNTVKYCKSWEEWKDRVGKLGRTAGYITDMLFDYPLYNWTRNLNDIIDGPGLTYTKTETRWEAAREILSNSVRVKNWSISGSDHTILYVPADKNYIDAEFTALGTKTVTAEVVFPDGTTVHRVSKTIRVTPPAFMSGPASPRISAANTYAIQNFEGDIDWSFGRYRADGTFQNMPADHISVPLPGNSRIIIAMKAGNYVVRACGTKNGASYEIDAKQITVPQETVTENGTTVESRIVRFRTYRSKSNHSVTHGTSAAGNPDSYEMGSDHQWKTFDRKPSAANACNARLVPVYRNNYYGNLYAYDTQAYPDFSGNNPPPVECHIFSVQLPGTEPLYSIEESEYVNEKRVYEFRYLSRVNTASERNVTSWVWNWLGTRKLRDRNWTETKNRGPVGYVYPV